MHNYDPIRQESEHLFQGQGTPNEINTAEIKLWIFYKPLNYIFVEERPFQSTLSYMPACDGFLDNSVFDL